jgi:uncharacterized Zn finger protein (UPF0148 family)
MTRFSVTCPHCQALLEIDQEEQLVVSAKAPERPKSTTSLDDRLRALSQEKEDARNKLAEAMRSEKAGAAIREEKFKKLLESAKSEPVEKPVRDIDLD